MPPEVEFYRTRFGLGPPLVATPPRPNLGVVVVVPCHDEASAETPLRALGACRVPDDSAVEVVAVVNGTSEDPPETTGRDRALAWVLGGRGPLANGVAVHSVAALDLSPQRAGVGLARKLGMDEALYRLSAAGALDGVIASFDADCACDPDYLVALHGAFTRATRLAAAAVRFEHPIDRISDALRRRAIARYELGLRCYVDGLRRARYPNAFHTVGSAMAVRARDYAAVGGMNRRTAGEDFHFLHKVACSRPVASIADTRVLPSARPSHRVPFGTGRALRRLLSGDGEHRVYDPRCYDDLGRFVRGLAALGDDERRPDPPTIEREARVLVEACAAPVAGYLLRAGFLDAAAECAANTGAATTLRARLLAWFHGLRALQVVHALSDGLYPRVAVETAAARLLDVADGELDLEEALARLRERDRRAALSDLPQ